MWTVTAAGLVCYGRWYFLGVADRICPLNLEHVSGSLVCLSVAAHLELGAIRAATSIPAHVA